MLGNDYKTQTCSVAGALEVIGERWSLLIVRDVFLGLRRFDAIQANLGIARNVLQARLHKLIDQGVLERRLYQEGSVAATRPLNELFRLYGGGERLAAGTAMFCGTLAVHGAITPAENFAMELDDPVLRRKITHSYRVHNLPDNG